MEKSYYQAFVFDMDGTIVDTLSDMMYSVNRALEIYHLPLRAREEYKTFVGNGSVKLVERALGKENLSYFDDVFKTYYEYYHEHFMDKAEIYPHLKEALDYAKEKGILLFVYTNKPEAIAREVADGCFGKGYFKKVIGVPLGGKTKPDPTAYLEGIKKYGISLDRQAYFGDSVTDIETAHNIGIKDMYSVLWGYQSKEKLSSALYFPKAFLTDASQIKDVVDYIL